MRAAILTSLNEREATMFSALAPSAEFVATPAGRDFLIQLAGLIGRHGVDADVDRVDHLIEAKGKDHNESFSFALASALREGLGSRREGMPAAAMTPVLDRTRAVATDPAAPEAAGRRPSACSAPLPLPRPVRAAPDAGRWNRAIDAIGSGSALDEFPDPRWAMNWSGALQPFRRSPGGGASGAAQTAGSRHRAPPSDCQRKASRD